MGPVEFTRVSEARQAEVVSAIESGLRASRRTEPPQGVNAGIVLSAHRDRSACWRRDR
jgi:hypothetical protein